MNVKQYEEIKEKLKQATTEKIQAETQIQGIERTWKEEFDIFSLKDAEHEREELIQKIGDLEKKQEKLFEEIQDLMDRK